MGRCVAQLRRALGLELRNVRRDPLAGYAVGGAQVAAGTPNYNLQLAGNVYYSTGQADVCSGATTTAHH